MTSRERSDLAALIRRRERVAKTEMNAVKAERLAQFEAQLATTWSAQDEQFRDLTEFAQQIVAQANAQIQARCVEMGVPERFRPSLGLVWNERGETSLKERRAELRRVAQTRADADHKAALEHIESKSVDTQEALLRDGLTTEAAQKFLEAMPRPHDLLPPLELGSLLRALPEHRDDPGWRYGSEYRKHYLNAQALDEMLASLPDGGVTNHVPRGPRS